MIDATELQKMVGKTIVKVEDLFDYTDDRIRIEFSDGTCVRISSSAPEYNSCLFVTFD